MALHWLIAILLITNIGLAWYFESLPRAERIEPMQLHKSVGMTVLMLSVLRLVWRFVRPPPPLPASVSPAERFVAGAVYVLFYVVMIGMPLSGWALTSASPLIRVYPITFFGLFEFPAIEPLANLPRDDMREAHETGEAVHGALARLAYALIVLHVLAALRHLLWLRDGVVARIVPFLPFPRPRA